MPYDLSDLDSNTATCTSPHGIEITYRLANVTPRLLRQFSAIDDGAANELRVLADRGDALSEMVRALVTRWDLTDSAHYDGPVPLTAEALADVRVEILADVVWAIIGDAGGNPTSGTASAPESRASGAPARGTSSRKRA